MRKVKTVSYTHLRAHETVLDLVCRLLLEKKKILTPPHTLQCHLLSPSSTLFHIYLHFEPEVLDTEAGVRRQSWRG
ncbi:hypothetical protein PVA38_11735 [Streptococcus pneumoniae D39]|nr:hypothetical protein PVA38_11735 [Streptococcus pneumoniae D39]